MRTHSDKHMSRETMDQAINFIKTNVAENQTVFVSFYGGEALMQMEIIRKFKIEVQSVVRYRP